MHTVLSTLHTPNGSETLPVSVPTYATPRSIIRRAKSAHGLKCQHASHEAVGPDGCTYIYVRCYGSKATLTIDLDTLEVEE